jgi:hypothetical protein
MTTTTTTTTTETMTATTQSATAEKTVPERRPSMQPLGAIHKHAFTRE